MAASSSEVPTPAPDAPPGEPLSDADERARRKRSGPGSGLLARAAIAAVVGLCAGEALADVLGVVPAVVALLVVSAAGALALARSGRASAAGIAGLLAIGAMTA